MRAFLILLTAALLASPIMGCWKMLPPDGNTHRVANIDPPNPKRQTDMKVPSTTTAKPSTTTAKPEEGNTKLEKLWVWITDHSAVNTCGLESVRGLGGAASQVRPLRVSDGRVKESGILYRFRDNGKDWNKNIDRGRYSLGKEEFCENPESVCHTANKLLFWFDSSDVHHAEKIELDFSAAKTHTFAMPGTRQCCEGTNVNWFGADTPDKRCSTYLKKSMHPDTKHPFSGYYLVDKANGVEAILNHEDTNKFLRGEITVDQLEKPCAHQCRLDPIEDGKVEITYTLTHTTGCRAEGGDAGLKNGFSAFSLVQIENDKVSDLTDAWFKEIPSKMWDLDTQAYEYDAITYKCGHRKSFCDRIDKLIWWFDSGAVSYAKELVVDFGDKRHVFAIGDKDCCGAGRKNWFGWDDRIPKRCLDYFQAEQPPWSRYPMSGYYLIDKEKGVEAIMNQADYVRFTEGQISIHDLQKPCERSCEKADDPPREKFLFIDRRIEECSDEEGGEQNGAMIFGLVQMEAGRVVNYGEETQYKQKGESWNRLIDFKQGEVPAGYCDLPATQSFCHNLDKLLIWFDSDRAHFSSSFSVEFKDQSHTFSLTKDGETCCTTNWFAVKDPVCTDYFDKSTKKGANYAGAGWYLVDKVNGVEGILNEEDKQKFVKGELSLNELRENCERRA